MERVREERAKGEKVRTADERNWMDDGEWRWDGEREQWEKE